MDGRDGTKEKGAKNWNPSPSPTFEDSRSRLHSPCKSTLPCCEKLPGLRMLKCSNWLTKRPPRREERRRNFGHEAHAQAAFFSVTSCEWRAARPAPEGKDRGEGASGPLGHWTAGRGTHHSPLKLSGRWLDTRRLGHWPLLGPGAKVGSWVAVGRTCGRGSIRLTGYGGLVALAEKGCSRIPASLLFFLGTFSLGILGRPTAQTHAPAACHFQLRSGNILHYEDRKSDILMLRYGN